MMMKLLWWLPVLVLAISCGEKEKRKILVFSKTKEFRHESIPAGKTMMLQLGNANRLLVDTTENADVFRDTTLAHYDVIVFMNTTGDVLDSTQQLALESFVSGGKGFVGIHSACDTEYQWPWYGKLIGAYFKSHPKVQRALFKKAGDDALVEGLPDPWYRTDEIYNFQALPQQVNVLFSVIENSYEGGEHPDHHPIAWYHEYEGGRVFYTAMGHTKESYSDIFFQQHILKGIQYALGPEKD